VESAREVGVSSADESRASRGAGDVHGARSARGGLGYHIVNSFLCICLRPVSVMIISPVSDRSVVFVCVSPVGVLDRFGSSVIARSELKYVF
jgi:hypothetical protein